MYLNMLKKDLKRKKTMNIILLIFVILATTFISSSMNNVISISTALDNYFGMANVADYWVVSSGLSESEKIEQWCDKNGYKVDNQELWQLKNDEIMLNGEEFEYPNIMVVSTIENTINIFDKDNNKITNINDGEIYLTAETCSYLKAEIGDEITLKNNDKLKKFTIKGTTKDAMYGSAMIGMTRFLISENDYEYFELEEETKICSISIYADDIKVLVDAFNDETFQTMLQEDIGTIKLAYIMDMVVAAVLLIVSICLIIISMVILRFAINFTMSEEYHEIGVMKAIGIRNGKIRGLYIVKYLAISVVGGLTGLILGFPFGNMLLDKVSRNIVIGNEQNYIINILCTFLVVTVVVLFSYLCTGKVKTYTPIDAIRNGENGNRYKRKSLIKLSKSPFSPIVFMALNDVLSGIRRYSVMLIIFTLGILLAIIPVNTTNTLKSDKLVKYFGMAESDHILVTDDVFSNVFTSKEEFENELDTIKEKLSKKDVKADVFKEIMFRMIVTKDDKKTSSIALQGIGDVTTDMYTYLDGTAPQNKNEVAMSHIIAAEIGAEIGDTVSINIGSETRKYTITAIYQTMNNMGEGIHFHNEENLDYQYSIGSFGTQIKYTDNPDKKELKERQELLRELYQDGESYTSGEYLSHMMGDVASMIDVVKVFIVVLVVCINMLVTVLMVKSFITKETGEIGMLKAIGFRNSKLAIWQSIRIGIVLICSAVIGTTISTPISELSSGQVFKMMGLKSIEFQINPLEVYVIYPLIVLVATVFVAFLTAQQVRKISASETSNIE